MSTVSYALREEFAGTVEQEIDGETREVPAFTGGVFRAGLDRDLDLRAMLDDTGELGHGPAGVIVVDDTDTAATVVLDSVPVLKRVSTPEEAEDVSRWDDPGATKAALVAEADRRGIAGATALRRDDLAAVLTFHDRLVRDGGEVTLDRPGDEPDVTVTATGDPDGMGGRQWRAADLLEAANTNPEA